MVIGPLNCHVLFFSSSFSGFSHDLLLAIILVISSCFTVFIFLILSMYLFRVGLHWCVSFSLLVVSRASLAVVQRPHCGGFSCCRAQVLGRGGFWSCRCLGSRTQARSLWLTGIVAPWHAGSSRIRNKTQISCTGRQILYHWAPREAPTLFLMYPSFSLSPFLFFLMVILSHSTRKSPQTWRKTNTGKSMAME